MSVDERESSERRRGSLSVEERESSERPRSSLSLDERESSERPRYPASVEENSGEAPGPEGLEPTLPVFYLYRQRLPAAAPQAVQILSSCHALAVAGATVRLVVDRPLPSDPERPAPAEVLADYGLSPHPRLELSWLERRHPTLAGLEYRAALVRWLRDTAGAERVVLSRRADYAARLLRLRRRFGLRFRLCYEWHYVGSANALEAGDPGRARALERDEAVVLAQADGHVVVSTPLQAWLVERHSPPGPIEVIPNGGPEPLTAGSPAEKRSAAGLTGGGASVREVIYAGLFRRPADFGLLFQAMDRLPPDVRLLIVGGDEEQVRLEQVRSMLRDAGLEARVRLFGARTVAETRRMIEASPVAVATFADSLNMRHFACPLKILEYQAAVVSLVATDHPTTRALVDDGVNGLLVPPDDPEALARAIRRLLDDRPLRDVLRAGGLRSAADRTWRRRGEHLLRFLLSLRGPGTDMRR